MPSETTSSLATAAFRLSTQQERGWLEHERGARQFAQCAIGIEGPLDLERLKTALQQAVAKYEILRTVLRRQTGVKLPFQVIQEDAAFHFEQEAGGKIEDHLRRERESLNAEDSSALRTLLISTSAERHTLVLTLPVACADYETLENLFREIAAGYGGEVGSVSDEVMQYADLVEWQNELLTSEETKTGRDFWRNGCRGVDFAALQSSALPLEKKEDASFRSSSFAVAIPGLSKSIENLASQRKTSQEIILLSAWTALLSRLTGIPDTTTGVEFHGRRYEELARALGPLARSLPIRMEISPETRFSDLLARASAASEEARNWQESFAWSQACEVESPFLPFAFDYHDSGGKEIQARVTFGLERVWVVSERFKLRLSVVRRGAELELEFEYDASRLDRSAVECIAGYYQNLLAAAMANPETRVSRLPLLSENDRREMLVEWNQTATEYPVEKCLHQLFEQQAARTPEREAVRCGEVAFTYRELNERANQLAHYLRGLGVGADRPVGLCLERSAETMVTVLAILKAGGAYVPLNPDNPPARLLQQLHGAAAVITEAKLSSQLPAFVGQECPTHTIVLDREQQLWAKESKENPKSNTTPENLVYVIYTSGSTGVPKGVAVRHRNLVNYADFIAKRLELEKYPEGLQFATVSTLGADLGNTCIYPSLISGGALHIIGYEMATDPRKFAEYVAKYPIDVLKIVPSHLQALVQSDDAAKLLPRKYLIFGGETLTPKLLEKIEALNLNCGILNHYGPTETTVGSLTLKLRGENQNKDQDNDYDWKHAQLASIPIGRPIQNTQVYILDANLEPVPVGVIGELYIAGAGVTAGYLGQAEKTAERFVKNPFATGSKSATGETMYRTGDLARYGADGNIEFLGRGDDQVKIRGFRIELGEIEAVLARHAGVKQAVVLARAAAAEKEAGKEKDEPGEKRLLAYVVAHRDAALGSSAGSSTAAEITGETLRAYLRQELPDYMVPQAVMVLAKLPLNANGKIDRQALPEPEQLTAAKTYAAPRTTTEKAIAEIWAEVLRRKPGQISVDDNFFDLGGHSLLATQVISRIRRTLNIELPLRTLFESPTVAALAQQAEKSAALNEPEIAPMVKVPRDKPLPLSFAQQRLWVLDRMEPDNPLYNIPRAVRLTGELNTKALVDSLNEIVRRHESQRTTFDADKDGEPIQVIAESFALNIPTVDLSTRPGAEREAAVREIAAKEAQTPFDLSKGPLLRATIVKLDSRDHVLLLTMHHIVSDAWSAAIFFQELGVLYTAFAAGKPSPLPELAVQYADYAAWQRKFLQGKALEDQISYWREHLIGAPPLLQLPADRPRPEVRKFEGTYEPIPVRNDVAEAVKAFCQQEGVTPFMALLAAFKALLFRYSGQEHIVLGTDIANRTTDETEKMIGFFINLLPLHTDLTGDPTFRELVARVREVALGAYAHQDIPFDKLVQDLQPERSSSHNPIVQALFVMQNIPPQTRELPGLEVTYFPTPITRSKFDVGVFMRENAKGMFQDWLYSTELFDRSTILRMASHFENLLGQALSHPETRLSALEMRNPEEIQQMEKEKTERKQSQRKKLIAVEPKAVPLGSASPKKEG
jgi:amino acid adenylation domain-containing protein